LGHFQAAQHTVGPPPTLLYLNLSSNRINTILKHVCGVIESQIQSLLSIDLSWGELSGRDLNALFDHFLQVVTEKNLASPLRSLNISYNKVGYLDPIGEASTQ